MNYWPCEVLGLPECHLPMMDLLTELADAGKQTAKEYYHMNGWVAHHNADLWRDVYKRQLLTWGKCEVIIAL